MELNKVLLIGNLTRDPESRFLESGIQVVKMGLACNRRYTSHGEKQIEEVLFVDVEAWAKTAELCVQYLRKGSQCLVEGRLKLDQYTTQQGEKRQRLFVVADRVQFGAKPQNEQDAGGGAAPAPRRPSRREAMAQQSDAYADHEQGVDDSYTAGASNDDWADQPSADDLPF